MNFLQIANEGGSAALDYIPVLRINGVVQGFIPA